MVLNQAVIPVLNQPAIVIFVLNAGSSSVKWRLVDGETGTTIRGGVVERLGHAGADGREHGAVISTLLAGLEHERIAVIGHHVVHGGDRFAAAALITDEVEHQIDELATLAPLHNSVNLTGIRAARAAFPDIPNVAVFDTAFHRTLPAASASYALPADLVQRHQIRLRTGGRERGDFLGGTKDMAGGSKTLPEVGQ